MIKFYCYDLVTNIQILDFKQIYRMIFSFLYMLKIIQNEYRELSHEIGYQGLHG